MGIFDRLRGDQIKIRIVIHGAEGAPWQALDTHLRVPATTTLSQLVDAAETARIPLRTVLAQAPELAERLCVNGVRCPLSSNGTRPLADGDEVVLAPTSTPSPAVDS